MHTELQISLQSLFDKFCSFGQCSYDSPKINWGHTLQNTIQTIYLVWASLDREYIRNTYSLQLLNVPDMMINVMM
jgi:hypothetical protein